MRHTLLCILVVVLQFFSLSIDAVQMTKLGPQGCGSVALIASGTRDDVQPVLTVGWYLRKRGCKVTLLSSPEHEALARSLRVNFEPLPHSLKDLLQTDEKYAETALASEHTGAQTHIDAYRRTSEVDISRALRKFVEQEGEALELVIGSNWHWATLLSAAESFVDNENSPLFVAASSHPSEYRDDLEFVFSDKVQLLRAGVIFPSDRVLKTHTNGWRARHIAYEEVVGELRRDVWGLENDQISFESFETFLKGESELVSLLHLYDEKLLIKPSKSDHARGSPRMSLMEGHTFFGYGAHAATIEPFIATALNTTENAPVFVSFGSVCLGTQATAGLVSVLVGALERVGLDAIIQRGWQGLDLSHIEDPELHSWAKKHVMFVDDLNHDWIMSQASVNVIHAGGPTTHAAMRSGRPMIVSPFVDDQTFWATRIHELGVGLRVAPPPQLSVEMLADALEKVLGDKTMANVGELLLSRVVKKRERDTLDTKEEL